MVFLGSFLRLHLAGNHWWGREMSVIFFSYSKVIRSLQIRGPVFRVVIEQSSDVVTGFLAQKCLSRGRQSWQILFLNDISVSIALWFKVLYIWAKYISIFVHRFYHCNMHGRFLFKALLMISLALENAKEKGCVSLNRTNFWSISKRCCWLCSTKDRKHSLR